MEASTSVQPARLEHIVGRHCQPLQRNGKSYFLSSDLKRINELIKETIENPDVIQRHRTRRDRGVKKKIFETVVGVHGITCEPCYSVTVIFNLQDEEIITAFPTIWPCQRWRWRCGGRVKDSSESRIGNEDEDEGILQMASECLSFGGEDKGNGITGRKQIMKPSWRRKLRSFYSTFDTNPFKLKCEL